MRDQRIEGFFPNLTEDSYSITSPESIDYNCIAWAVGNNSVWWWPDAQFLGYWPPEIPRTETLDAFIKAYENFGYILCEDASVELGFEKVAIYVDSEEKPTHAARQLISGRWTSKLGRLEDIEHDSLDRLKGLEYGSVAAILKRPTAVV